MDREIIILIVVLVIAVLLFTGLNVFMGIGSDGFRNWDITTWYNYWGHGSGDESAVEVTKIIFGGILK